jgi:hypothetical protein
MTLAYCAVALGSLAISGMLAWLRQRQKRNRRSSMMPWQSIAEPASPYRGGIQTPRTPVSKADVVAALQNAGIKVVATRKGFSISDGVDEQPVHVEFANRNAVTLASMRLGSNEVARALEIALALVPLFGPIMVDDTISVDGTVGIDELKRQLQQKMLQGLAHLMNKLPSNEALNNFANQQK